MHSIFGAILIGISSCATVPARPVASGELRLLSILVPEKEKIKVNFPFAVNINFEAKGEPEIRTACFYSSGDGPHRFKVTDVHDGSPGTIKIQIHTGILALVFWSAMFYISGTGIFNRDEFLDKKNRRAQLGWKNFSLFHS